MKELMAKLMKNKKSGKMDDMEKEAKMGVVKEMRDMASSALGDKLKGLKKVTVASNDEQGLKTGLEKAKDLLTDRLDGKDDLENSSEEHDEESHEDPKEEALESPEEEAHEDAGEEHDEEYAHLSPEELDAKIKELLALKEKIKA